MSDWEPEPREVPEELAPGYKSAAYEDPWNSIMQRLDAETIKKLARFVV